MLLDFAIEAFVSIALALLLVNVQFTGCVFVI